MIEKKNKRSDLCSNLPKQQVKSENQPEYIEVKDCDEENKYEKIKKQFSQTLNQVCQESESISIAKAFPSEKQQQSGKIDKNPKKIQVKNQSKNQTKTNSKKQNDQKNLKDQLKIKKILKNQRLQNILNKNKNLKGLRQEQLETFIQTKSISEVSKWPENQSKKQLNEIEKFNSQSAQKMTEKQKEDIQIDQEMKLQININKSFIQLPFSFLKFAYSAKSIVYKMLIFFFIKIKFQNLQKKLYKKTKEKPKKIQTQTKLIQQNFLAIANRNLVIQIRIKKKKN